MDGWVNNRESADVRRHRTHYDVRVMPMWLLGFAHILGKIRATVKPVCNDHLYNEIYYLLFIQQCALMKTEGTN